MDSGDQNDSPSTVSSDQSVESSMTQKKKCETAPTVIKTAGLVTGKTTHTKTNTTNTASKKRKFDELQLDGDTNSADIDTEPNQKKRKCNSDELNLLIESNKIMRQTKTELSQQNRELKQSSDQLQHKNKQLSKENNYYKQSVSAYKKEINQWKIKYKKLQSQFKDFKSNNANNTASDQTDTANNNRKNFFNSIEKNGYITNLDTTHTYASVTDRLLAMGYDKNKITKRVSLFHGTNKSDDFVFHKLLTSFLPDIKSILPIPPQTNRQKQTMETLKTSMAIDLPSFPKIDLSQLRLFKDTNTRRNKNGSACKDGDGYMKYKIFEDCYYVSVKCHFCDDHFDDILPYREHLKEHYANTVGKTYLVCDFGCKRPKLESSENFTAHIASHTGDKPYHCTVVINGVQCTKSLSRKPDMKGHWRRHVQKIKKMQSIQEKAAKKERECELQKKSGSVCFEEAYNISVHCHICTKHFDDVLEYREHLETHYNNDSTMVWRICEFCEKGKFGSGNAFVEHLVAHTQDRPYECNQNIHGRKCSFAAGTKGGLKYHWQSNHRKKRERVVSDSSESDSESSVESSDDSDQHSSDASANRQQNKGIIDMDIDAEFEQSYYVSVTCHFCNKHFDAMVQYKQHLRDHYDSAPENTWLMCDFCSRPKLEASEKFTAHLASHTGVKPYHCNVVTNGVKCTKSISRKPDLKRHWKKHFNIPSLKIRKSRKDNPNGFEDSFIISVHCHVCSEHFEDTTEYRQHLQAHYDGDENMEWRVCDFGCERGKFDQTRAFIEHLASHTKDKPYECCLTLDNGHKCAFSAATKGGMKYHWKSHLEKMEFSESDSDYLSSESVEIKPKKRPKKEYLKSNCAANGYTKYCEFEDSFVVTVTCHVCSEYFEDIHVYRDHLKEHYTSDQTKTWLICDFGCERGKLHDSETFMLHLATHTGDRPYKCKVNVDGVRCAHTSGCKSNIKAHWKTHMKRVGQSFDKPYKPKHRKHKKKSKKKKRKVRKKPKIKTIKAAKVEFLDSYHISVNCHICSKWFRDIDEYCVHLEKHYNIDPTKAWLHCDFGCVQSEAFNKNEFLSHVAQHTKDGPFKCDTVINGLKCESSFGEMEKLEKHWKTHYPKTVKSESVSMNTKPKLNKNVRKRPGPIVDEDSEFEKSFYISIDCHVCQQHFEDIYMYREHLKGHYNSDANKTWMKCDLGCENKVCNTEFICHIASHTRKYPFQCSVIVNGRECEYTAGTKSNMKTHWNRMHNREYVRAGKRRGARYESSEESESESLSDSSMDSSDSESSNYSQSE